MLQDFPKDNTPQRDAKIIECVRNGRAKFSFAKVTSQYKDHKAEFSVFEDALKIDDVRVNVSAKLQQQIADMLNCILPTGMLYDLMWDQCKCKINPHPRPISSTTDSMIKHSQDIDADFAKQGSPSGLKASVGKIWIIDNSLGANPGKACNYGWHFTTGASFQGISGSPCISLLKNPTNNMYWHMIQGRGWHHDMNHVDYSQVCVLVSRDCVVDGNTMDILDVLKDPRLAPLANNSGVLYVLRQPNVPVMDRIG